MTDIKWIKISTEMFSDEKIKVIEAMPEADTVLLIWIKLLSLAGRTNAGGYIFLTEDVPYTEDTLSTVIGRPKTVVSMALTIFVKFKMITISDNGHLLITNWGTYQNVDGMERIRALTTARVQKYRENKAITDCNVTVALPVTNVTHTDIDIDKEKEKNLNTLAIDLSKEKSKAQPKISFDRDNQKFIGITEKDIDLWMAAYPAVDLNIETAKAIAWIFSAGSKGYKSNWRKFLTGWYSRVQDRGGNNARL